MRMFTFAILYICFYYQVLYILFLYLNIYLNITNIQYFNISNVINLIRTYLSHYKLMLLIFLLLSGLPPVLFFILKLTFLINIFPDISFITQIILFINFLLGMFFYLQCFNITNSLNINNAFLISICRSNTNNIISKNYYEFSSVEYIFWKLYIGCITVHIFGLFFFFDIFIIIDSCIY